MNNRILLVDDEETIRYVLSETLRGEGYNVDVARDAFHALERFKNASYDLIITDIKMHGMDGIQLIREIKKINPKSKIIIITAYGSLETVKEAAELGVVNMISKPFKIKEIKDVIIKMLEDYSISNDNHNEMTGQFQTKINAQLSKTVNILKPNGLSYYFGGPAYQPENTVVFDACEISKNRSTFIFGNINDQNGYHREWWENMQIGIMIKTLFRSSAGNTPPNVINSINKFLCENILPHIKVSMLCVLIDKRKMVIKYINSGNNLVCAMIAPGGEIEIMESNPYPLGISPRIDLVEGAMPYSHENRLMLSRSNKMSKIVEEGAIIKQKIENALQNIKGSKKEMSKETDRRFLQVNSNDVNLDGETVLLINL